MNHGGLSQSATSQDTKGGKRGSLPLWRNKAHSRLVWRLAATFLLTTLTIVLVLGATVYLLTRYYVLERLEADLSAQAGFYAAYGAQLASSEAELAALAPTLVRHFAPQADLNVRVFAASSGTILAATEDIGPQPSQVALRALAYRSPTLFTSSSRDLPGRRYAAQAIQAGSPAGAGSETAIGVVEVSRTTQVHERFLTSLRRILYVAVLLAAALTLLVSTVLARRLSRPISDMEQATQRIAAGDLDTRLAGYGSDELGRLAASINHMAARLTQLEEARSQFISEIAHDLRTPLAGIKGLLVNLIDVSTVDDPAGENDSAAGMASLRLAERETDRLIRLVNQLLDLARWQGGRLALDRHPTDICALARSAAALCQERARHRNIELRVDLPAGASSDAPDDAPGHAPGELPPIHADADRLERVLLNLLDNAIRFTPGGGQVLLTVEKRADEVEISVLDTGRGMSEQEQQHAFEAHYRGQGGGSGLGLTISQAIVQAHGGRMGIESPIGGREAGILRQAQDADPGALKAGPLSPSKAGTRVWFTLPL
jgi:signal transduction histidine kinase